MFWIHQYKNEYCMEKLWYGQSVYFCIAMGMPLAFSKYLIMFLLQRQQIYNILLK